MRGEGKGEGDDNKNTPPHNPLPQGAGRFLLLIYSNQRERKQ
jgi:hypothetical protein